MLWITSELFEPGSDLLVVGCLDGDITEQFIDVWMKQASVKIICHVTTIIHTCHLKNWKRKTSSVSESLRNSYKFKFASWFWTLNMHYIKRQKLVHQMTRKQIQVVPIFDTLNWSHWLVEFYAVASQLSVLAVIIWLNSNSSQLEGVHLHIRSIPQPNF